ncbi:hypothetical protein G6F16_012408 [Rhizopus arrhizus]|nr:hypothetical protein G6F21_012263 [Rhizopus arrhizus]KAG0780385.1 hypothetical protein G6F22_010114 [Rhizopus arrhizus]KAG0820509.1 hypothetical protein G6F19_012430 [Rhizopus arrhizus]KAG0862606.1 hypothetical protein G6F16_012408 [Rhizopus arrhizus]KAG0890609.1 hypothetical protein G6F34_012382 [Rhizopus arrhizus]
MPVEYGGLKVLNPIIQHKLLQKRWLNYLLDPIDYPSFVYPIMANHLSQFKNSQDFPLLPFYNKECRVSPVSPRHLSIWPVIFEMFDYFNDDGKIQMNQVPVPTLLAMPLRHLLTYPSSQESEYTHWTLKHANYAANLFLTFDISQQRLRLKIQGEYSRFPRLCQSLYNEILVSRNIKLKPFVWSHIVAPPVTNATTIEEWKMHHLVTTMKSNHRWYQFCPQTLRNRYQITGESMILFGAADIKEFWRTIMYPQARTIFFRTFSKCIPSKDLLFKFTVVSSPICSFCGSTEDSFKHFLVLCAPKQVIWYQVLSHYYPHLYFSPEDLILTLTSLKKPYWVRYCSKYIPIISTILWQQWNSYWSHGTENINPISTIDVNKSIPRIVSLIERLLHPISSD